MASRSGFDFQLTTALVDRIRSIFSPQWYLDTNGDVAESGLDPFEHFVSFGFNEGRDATPLFDEDFYCQRAEVPKEQSPLIHYLLVGGVQGYDPHPLMNNMWYRNSLLEFKKTKQFSSTTALMPLINQSIRIHFFLPITTKTSGTLMPMYR